MARKKSQREKELEAERDRLYGIIDELIEHIRKLEEQTERYEFELESLYLALEDRQQQLHDVAAELDYEHLYGGTTDD
jgi:hypothetical protein